MALLSPDAPNPPPHAPAPLRYHDGFYLRLGVGASYGRALIQTDRTRLPDVGVTGLGGSFDLWLGWTVAPGLVLGPALSSFSARTSGVEVDGEPTNDGGNAAEILLGAVLDAYPNPADGYHFGGLLAIASLTASVDGNGDADYRGAGVGVGVFAGYDAWVAREWSLGGLLRLGGAVTRDDDSVAGVSVTKQGIAYSAALLFTAVYH